MTTSAVEVCYCKPKLFRDYKAERKISNDVQRTCEESDGEA